MTCRCPEVGLDEIFDEDFARGDANRYRKRGLPPRARKLLRLIEQQIDLRSVQSLEAGAGAGALTIELARRGAAHARGIDAMPHVISHAQSLARDFGVADRTDFAVGDFAEKTDRPKVDLVILDRVVCCYPEWRALLENAALAARRVIALSYPADRALSRLFIRLTNASQALRRRQFRLQFHSPAAMLGLLATNGFSIHVKQRYWFWEIAVASRSPLVTGGTTSPGP
jgi:2-polyprenyl-3-methyl-5-hydroxy-6-metoxy-1,4-benzoquinol methylase